MSFSLFLMFFYFFFKKNDLFWDQPLKADDRAARRKEHRDDVMRNEIERFFSRGAHAELCLLCRRKRLKAKIFASCQMAASAISWRNAAPPCGMTAGSSIQRDGGLAAMTARSNTRPASGVVWGLAAVHGSSYGRT